MAIRYLTTVQKTVEDSENGTDILYTFSVETATQAESESLACQYASMVEYGMLAERWTPSEFPFQKEQLYQYIQPNSLRTLEAMNPDAIKIAYASAYAYVHSYVGAMFDIDEMLDNNNTSSTSLTLRLALSISTATYLLASTPQYSEMIEYHNKQLLYLLRGLKSGHRNFGKGGITADPDVRVSIVSLNNTGGRP